MTLSGLAATPTLLFIPKASPLALKYGTRVDPDSIKKIKNK
jgi:hypothetical protein